jgi:hypothetical protein
MFVQDLEPEPKEIFIAPQHCREIQSSLVVTTNIAINKFMAVLRILASD